MSESESKVSAFGEADSLSGQSLGPYRILSQLGAGGMGEVYLAQDSRLGRKVALKLLPTYFPHDEQRMRRFRHEARSASALNHPNILTIHEIGEIAGKHFIATEYIEGETLRQRMSRGCIGSAEALEIATQVASALAEAHKPGIVHRDIKPENIMVRRDGLVKILDFGLAKLTEKSFTRGSDPNCSTLVQTDPNVVMGTVRYMSPEQARGLAVDARTDIWSLGVVLYEMLTEHPPFEGETSTDVIISVLQKEPPPLAAYTKDAPLEMERIVRKALAKELAKRYQTAEEMLADLKSLKRELEFAAQMGRPVTAGINGEAATVQKLGRAARKRDAEPAARPPSTAEYLVTEIKSHRTGALLTLTVVLIAIAGFASFRYFRSETINSLAVVPFVNASADPNVEYVVDGIAEGLINNLSHLPNMKVMSRSAVFRYKGGEIDVQRVGRELGVQAVLTGKVTQIGDGLSISIELADARDNSHIWGEQYNRSLSDLLAVQREISREVSEKLRLRLTGEEQQRVTRSDTQSAEAYQLFMKGRYYLERKTEDDIKQAIKSFQQAIEKDPRYAQAYAELANAYAYLGDYQDVSQKENYINIKTAATTARDLDETLGEPHAILGDLLHQYEWDWSGAEREFKRAIELNPNYAEAHHIYSHYLLEKGRVAESLVESRRNLELDPLSPATNLHLGWHYLYARQYDQAIEQERKTLDMDHNYARAYLYLAEAYVGKGLFDEAIEAYLKNKMLDGGTAAEVAALKAAYTKAGFKAYWQKALELALERSKSRYVAPYNIAVIYGRLGEKDKAFEMLEKAYAEHSKMMVGLNLEFAFDGLRSEPRFADLQRRIGLPH
jgi:TolB-like protein/Tfp pilus assembly protein PilF